MTIISSLKYLLKIVSFFVFILGVGVLPVCAARGIQKKVWDLLGLELQMVASRHVDSGN